MTDQNAGLENAGPGKRQTKWQFWFWKSLTSILVKIRSSKFTGTKCVFFVADKR